MLPRDRAQTSEEGILCNLEVTERMPDPRADLSSPAMAILAVLQARYFKTDLQRLHLFSYILIPSHHSLIPTTVSLLFLSSMGMSIVNKGLEYRSRIFRESI